MDVKDDSGKVAPLVVASADAGLSYAPNAIHLMRTTQQMQLQLSQMADQKASILMGATFVSFTISIGQLASGKVSPALVILATFALLAVVLSMMVVMPQLGSAGTRKLEGNLLFFGEFARMSEADFRASLKQQLLSDDLVYSAIARDIYQNGQVCQRVGSTYIREDNSVVIRAGNAFVSNDGLTEKVGFCYIGPVNSFTAGSTTVRQGWASR
jgi:hypothetical protein